MIERQVDIETAEGRIDTFICHPEEGGPFPVVIFYMDAPGIREELRDMARRLATVGYYVLLPNLYYRTCRADNPPFDYARVRESQVEMDKMFALMRSIGKLRLIEDDTRAMLDFLAKDEQAKEAPYGCVGYCMSGQYVFMAAGAFSEQFAAAASIYGVGCVTERDDSPHLRAKDVQGELYFAFAENDSYVPPEVIEQLGETLASHGTKHRIEIYPGTEHGFAFPQRHCYNRQAAERHWERLFSLFGRCL